MSVEQFGIKAGRLWLPWPEFRPNDLWIGVACARRNEGGRSFLSLYIQPLPAIRVTLELDRGAPRWSYERDEDGNQLYDEEGKALWYDD